MAGYLGAKAHFHSLRASIGPLCPRRLRPPKGHGPQFRPDHRRQPQHHQAQATPGGVAGAIAVHLAAAEDGGSVLLRVEDDGVGMPPGSGISSGLGHTVVTGLLRSMQATMAIGPVTPGRARPGTRVTLVIPRAEDAGPA